jgi:hypothetical protein
MSKKQKQQQKQKPPHEGKNKKPSTAGVSLDNADTVIEGGPVNAVKSRAELGEAVPRSSRSLR